jgi:hypothetical protein
LFSSSSSSSSCSSSSFPLLLHPAKDHPLLAFSCVQDLSENNRHYKERLGSHESGRKQQVSVLRKVHASQLADRDRLITSLQSVLEEHEKTIQQLESRLYGQFVCVCVSVCVSVCYIFDQGNICDMT